MKKVMALLLALHFLGFPSVSQETTPQEAQESLLSERKQVVLYGTEGEIMDLLKTLQEQKDNSLVESMASLLEGKISARLTRALFDFFRNLEWVDPRPEEYALRALQTPEELDQETLATFLQYLSLGGFNPHPERVLPLLRDSRRRVVLGAVRYLGKKGNPESVSRLVELFKVPESDEELRTTILTALGELKDPGALEFLHSVLQNPDERIVYRRFACDALGKIGAKESYPIIKKALEEGDNLLRAYAINALGSYQEPEVEQILLQALRDDFARIRVFAAEKLGQRKSSNAVDILIFRVRRDGDRQVRLTSLRALGEIGTEKAVTFLREFLLEDRSPLELRLETIRLLVQNPQKEGIEAVRTLLEREWTKENSRLLDEGCKQLSLQTNPAFADLYEKMLTHRAFTIRLYGIRGIGRNNLRSLEEQIRKLAKEGASSQERKEARMVLEQWGLTP